MHGHSLGGVFFINSKQRVQRSGTRDTIERNLDFKRFQTVITAHGNYSFKWLSGLALDLSERHVYFVDEDRRAIYSCDYLGAVFRTVVQSTQTGNPFSLALSAKWFVWTDWFNRSIIARGRCSGQQIEVDFLGLSNDTRRLKS